MKYLFNIQDCGSKNIIEKLWGTWIKINMIVGIYLLILIGVLKIILWGIS